jgi:hypothetical protein
MNRFSSISSKDTNGCQGIQLSGDQVAHSLKEEALSYYPPRARWYSRTFFALWQTFRSSLHLGQVDARGACSVRQFLLSVAVPGFGFFTRGRFLAGGMFLAGYCLMGLLFLAALGYLAGSIGYGMLISIHAISLFYFAARWLGESTFSLRVTVALLTLLIVWGLIYAPAANFAQRHWFVPLRVGSRVMVINRAVPAGSLRRGDLVAHEILEHQAGGVGERAVYLRSGLSIDPVLAIPGDRVGFTPQALTVNEVSQARARFMPVGGEFVVPEKVWFIWPNLGINRAGAGFESSIAGTLQKTAMVSENQIIGRPFKHWFGRQQLP